MSPHTMRRQEVTRKTSNKMSDGKLSLPVCIDADTTDWVKKGHNAQRDGRPAEHRWRPLFNAAKFG